MLKAYWKTGEFKWWILLICAYQFFPFITARASIVMYTVAYFIPGIYILLHYKLLLKLVNSLFKSVDMTIFLGVAALSLCAIALPTLYGTGDLTFFTDAIMTLIKTIFRYVFLSLLIYQSIPKADKYTVYKYYIFSCCLYICSTLLMLVIPPVKTLFFNIVKETPHAKELAMEAMYRTRYGWAGFSGFEFTFKMVIAAAFNLFFFRENQSSRSFIAPIIVSIFLFAGTLFYGRTGTICMALILLYMLICLAIRHKKLFLILVGVGVVGIGLLILLKQFVAPVNTWFNWAFEPILVFFRSGKFAAGSLFVLFGRMLFFPKIGTFFLGDAKYMENGLYYMQTDAGIMRPLLFGGILFALLRAALLYFPLGIRIKRSLKLRSDLVVYIAVAVTCILFEIKGEILFSCIPILLCAWLLEDLALPKAEIPTRELCDLSVLKSIPHRLLPLVLPPVGCAIFFAGVAVFRNHFTFGGFLVKDAVIGFALGTVVAVLWHLLDYLYRCNNKLYAPISAGTKTHDETKDPDASDRSSESKE